MFPVRKLAGSARILLIMRLNYGVIRLEACRSVSIKCIWKIPVKGMAIVHNNRCEE